MKKFLTIQALTTCLVPIFMAIIGAKHSALSFFCGSSLIFGNVVILAFVWSRLIQKKLIALAIVIIVIKYAILAGIIFEILQQPDLQVGWFCLGLGTIVASALIFSLSSAPEEEEACRLA